jgi:hypothetical protein
MGEERTEMNQTNEKYCQNCRYYNLNLYLAATFCEKKKKYLEGEEAFKNVCGEWEKEATREKGN